MEKSLKRILELRDKSIRLYDAIRFSKDISYNDFKIISEQLRILTYELINNMNCYMPVIATEDCIIEPNKRVELKTNINLFPVSSLEENNGLEFTQEGIVSTYGDLLLSVEKDYENGNKIWVYNTVPKEVLEKNNCGYHFESATSTRHFWAGVYMISKGETVGLIGLDSSKIIGKENEKNEEISRQLKKMKLTHIDN